MTEDPDDATDPVPSLSDADSAEERVQPLSVRDGRRPVLEPMEGVPGYLEDGLRRWVEAYLNLGQGTGNRGLPSALERRIALHLSVALPSPSWRVADQPGVELLDVVDLALRLDAELKRQLAAQSSPWTRDAARVGRVAALTDLAQMLEDANSVYRVRLVDDAAQLVRVVDATMQAAAEKAMTEAEPTASDLLRRAWNAAYARTPTAPAAYRDAVLAVERLACQTVIPNDRDGTLGKVITCLRDAPQNWELELRLADDGAGRAVDTLRGMLALLWRGEKRHASGDYRDVTLAEARAAVHLAVTCVQWLTDHVLRPRPADNPS